MEKKVEYFNAFLIELLKWYKEENAGEKNDLSKLKVLKLLFLWASKNEKALDVFDKFVAWDLWPVEKDIYISIKEKNSDLYFEVTNSSSSKIEDWTVSVEAKEVAIEMINFLKDMNENLIRESASSLVDITHKWNCWDIARSFDMVKISKNLILSEEWYFS